MGRVLADYAGGSDESDNRSRSRRRQACVRCDDADEKDRHRCNRGGTPRVRVPLEAYIPDAQSERKPSYIHDHRKHPNAALSLFSRSLPMIMEMGRPCPRCFLYAHASVIRQPTPSEAFVAVARRVLAASNQASLDTASYGES